MRLRTSLTSLTVAVLVAACGGSPGSSLPGGQPSEPGAPQEDSSAGDPDLREAIDLAIEDAASNRGVSEDEIEVMAFDEVTWPDEALGCAAQSAADGNPVEGYFVQLNVGGAEMLYHGEQGEPPFHCEQPLTSGPG